MRCNGASAVHRGVAASFEGPASCLRNACAAVRTIVMHARGRATYASARTAGARLRLVMITLSDAPRNPHFCALAPRTPREPAESRCQCASPGQARALMCGGEQLYVYVHGAACARTSVLARWPCTSLQPPRLPGDPVMSTHTWVPRPTVVYLCVIRALALAGFSRARSGRCQASAAATPQCTEQAP